ncbi:porin [Haemophilus parainfluenzae]|uniref:Outer membrane protein P2 n=1 Tax=Haemophilus parainfluenzae TaxID=729 RepID=A0A377JGS7_HAEPA|nr:porin [Haemophilus parainfluenzae]MBS6285078.1 porin [Haemophilus parainfluenzae]STP03401.1 outer membrane protein P2-like protein [Haemophilus parainfluenzae]
MKKTLAALIVSAVAASAANAAVVYDNEGTKVELNGSLRLIMEKADKKVYDAANHSSKKANSALRNAGSRFGITVKHNLDNDFYALGRVEFRFDDTTSRDKFGGVYAKRAYVGLGSKAIGELKFGRQLTIADDLSQANDYEYGFIPKEEYIPTAGTGVVRYDYKGIEGLQLSANYNFGQKNNEKGKLLDTPIKNAYAVGALYTAGDLDARFAYGHTNFETGATYKHRVDGFLASLGYKFGDFTLTGDFGYGHEKENDAKTNKFYVSPGFAYQVTPASQVYGNYLYERVKGEADKDKTHGFLLGADYKLHKQVVVFLEGKYVTTKSYTNDTYTGKVKDRAIGVGMRVFF